jgi:hypothetical protein
LKRARARARMQRGPLRARTRSCAWHGAGLGRCSSVVRRWRAHGPVSCSVWLRADSATDTAAWCRRLEGLAASSALEGARSNQSGKAGGWVCPMTGYRHGKPAGPEAGLAWLESAFTTYDTAQLLQVSRDCG